MQRGSSIQRIRNFATGLTCSGASHEPPRPLLVNADDLEHWSDRYDAPAQLPLLIRRLVLAAKGVTNVSFRVGSGVRFEGWDGFCEGTENHPFVPTGATGWEFSVGSTEGNRRQGFGRFQ
jgi:hypothetical protein